MCLDAFKLTSGDQQSLDPPANPYGNIDISRALGVALFHSVTSVGVVHRQLFGPAMPFQPIAFVLTNVCNIPHACTVTNFLLVVSRLHHGIFHWAL
jgi:hypothetical protein